MLIYIRLNNKSKFPCISEHNNRISSGHRISRFLCVYLPIYICSSIIFSLAKMAMKMEATRGKVGIEGLREMISNQKQEIIVRFEKYHKALYESEAMLLADLDAILSAGEAEKRDIARQVREVKTVKDFICKQLETSINESLKNSVANLENEIQILKRNEDEVPVISLSWKFDNLLHLIHQLCSIEEKSTPIPRGLVWSRLDIKSSLYDCYDFTYDYSDKRYYFIEKYVNSSNIRINNSIRIYNSKLGLVSPYTLEDPSPDCYISTNSKSIFLSSPAQIIQLTKTPTSPHRLELKNTLKIQLNANSSKICVFKDFIYTTSNTNVVYKLSATELQILDEIHLRNEREENVKLEGIFDLKVTETEMYVLFSSPTLHAIYCFDLTGGFIREIVGSSRGLQNPLSFCFDNSGMVYVADGQVKAFDKLGKQVYAFGEEVADRTTWAKCVAFNSDSNEVLVLAQQNSRHMHAYK